MRVVTQDWIFAGIEPDVAALLHDDELIVMMRRDGLSEADYWRHINDARHALRRRAVAAKQKQAILIDHMT